MCVCVCVCVCVLVCVFVCVCICVCAYIYIYIYIDNAVCYFFYKECSISLLELRDLTRDSVDTESVWSD